MSDTIHSCGYHCQLPACIKAQRDELVAKYVALASTNFSEQSNIEAVEIIKSLGFKYEQSSDGRLHWVAQPAPNLKLDGDQWCATWPDFINLQESPAGFGDTPELAVSELSTFKGKNE